MHVYTLKLPTTFPKRIEFKKSRFHIKVSWVICQFLIIVDRYQFLRFSFLWHVLPAATALITEAVIAARLMYSWSYQVYYVRIHHEQRCFRWKKNWKTVNVSSNNICFHCDHQQRLPYEEKQKTKNYFIDFVMAFPFMNGVITTNIKTFSSRKVKPVHFSDYSFGETWNNCSFQQSKFKINIC